MCRHIHIHACIHTYMHTYCRCRDCIYPIDGHCRVCLHNEQHKETMVELFNKDPIGPSPAAQQPSPSLSIPGYESRASSSSGPGVLSPRYDENRASLSPGAGVSSPGYDENMASFSSSRGRVSPAPSWGSHSSRPNSLPKGPQSGGSFRSLPQLSVR
jgi:hypothetical protein